MANAHRTDDRDGNRCGGWLDTNDGPRDTVDDRETIVTFIDELLESGGNYIIQRTHGGASLRPASDSDADLNSFQTVVKRVRANAGNGFRIHMDHVSSDRPGNLVDMLILSIDD